MKERFFTVEIQRYLGPLILYGEGVVLELSHQGRSFFGRYQCDTHTTPASMLQQTYAKGKTLHIEACICNDVITTIPLHTPNSIQYQKREELHFPLDVIFTGTITHIDFTEEEAILNCGIPVCISWETAWGDRIGEKIRVQGDLTLYQAD